MKSEEKELDEYQIRNIKILTHLLSHDAVSDDIVEDLRLSELDYFSLMDKYKLLEQKINVDEKTSLLKFKNDYLTSIIKTASRIYYGVDQKKYYISFVRFDIDDFSRFNNEYGHDVGDKVLVNIANIIRDSSRPTDYAIRFGGEEFDVILPSTNTDGAVIYVKKVLEKIRKLKVSHNGSKLKITVSAGISNFVYVFVGKKLISDSDIENKYCELQSCADNALYEAKYNGKDRYSVYSEDKRDEYARVRKLYVK
jgi:diguanylate cyclase (GGDEF)-like protein